MTNSSSVDTSDVICWMQELTHFKSSVLSVPVCIIMIVVCLYIGYFLAVMKYEFIFPLKDFQTVGSLCSNCGWWLFTMIQPH